MILLQIHAVLRIGHWYRNHNYSDFFIGVIQSLSFWRKGTQALGTRLRFAEHIAKNGCKRSRPLITSLKYKTKSCPAITRVGKLETTFISRRGLIIECKWWYRDTCFTPGPAELYYSEIIIITIY